MQKAIILFSLFFLAGLLCHPLYAQQDSVIVRATVDSSQTKNPLASDTAIPKKFNPRTATIRSAILPGWGQAYNKKYWKIPIVYGALGVSAGVFFFNLKTYRQLRDAVILRQDTIPGNDSEIAPDLQQLNTSSLIFYRNAYRQNIDYSVLAFLVIWGLNVVDATVDAHLKAFDVSPDLTMKIRPQFRFETGTASLGLVFGFRDRVYKFNKPH